MTVAADRRIRFTISEEVKRALGLSGDVEDRTVLDEIASLKNPPKRAETSANIKRALGLANSASESDVVRMCSAWSAS